MRDELLLDRHPARAFCLSMIPGSSPRACLGKPNSTHQGQSPRASFSGSCSRSRRDRTPALDLRQFGFRPLGDHIAAAEIDRAASPSIESQSPSPIAVPASCAVRAAGSTDSAVQPTIQGLPICLATRGVRGASADGGDDTRRRGEARDVRGRGVGTNQNDRLAAIGEARDAAANRTRRGRWRCPTMRTCRGRSAALRSPSVC